jgi:hypothetical protein
VAEKARLTPTDVRGEIVYIQNLGIDTLPDGRFDMDYLAKQFRDCADKNQHLKISNFAKCINLKKSKLENFFIRTRHT